uniref:hypothetical protein n=1 Tax=Aquisphaera insulae TaxID=2712864 RepID=UPI00196A7466
SKDSFEQRLSSLTSFIARMEKASAELKEKTTTIGDRLEELQAEKLRRSMVKDKRSESRADAH